MARSRAVTVASLITVLGTCPVAGVHSGLGLRHKRQAHRRAALLAAVSGDCGCLNWKDVFTQRGGRCGQGFERFLSRSANGTGASLKTSLFQELWEGELCDRLFAKLDTNSCVQQNMGEGSNSAQAGWCYVNSTCSSEKLDLHSISNVGGKYLNNALFDKPELDKGASLSLRMCVPSIDHFLYELSPQDLYNFSVAQGLDMGHLVKLAYPTMGESWEKVSAAFLMNRSMTQADVSTRLRRTAERGNTVVWSSRNGLPPFGVTQGTSAWEVGLLPRAKRTVLDNPSSVEVWANVTKFRCVTGCPGSGPSDAPILPGRKVGMLQLGAPWRRGRGLVRMRGRRTEKHGNVYVDA